MSPKTLQPPHGIYNQFGQPSHIPYGPDNACGRPFCKLKKKEHYHCNICNQAFSELERLQPHIEKHSTGAISPLGAITQHNGAAEPEPTKNNAENSDHPTITSREGN